MKSCETCKHIDLLRWEDFLKEGKPCWHCRCNNDLSEWTPKEEEMEEEMKDYCETCKYFHTLAGEEPCKACISLSANHSKWEPKEEEKDNINPDHYKKETSLECIEAMEIIFGQEAVLNFCVCNAWKYIWRWKNKNGAVDLDKASWYLQKADDIIRSNSALASTSKSKDLKGICNRMYAYILNTEVENADDSVRSE